MLSLKRPAGLLLAVAIAMPAAAQEGNQQQVQAGRTLFAQCAACHATDAANGAGPGLRGVFGRSAAGTPGFRYSPAMKRAGIRWDDATLGAFLAGPQQVVPRNRMPYSGMPSAAERGALIAFLKTLNGQP